MTTASTPTTYHQLWHDEGWVFASPTGQPINPRTDYTEWKRLLKEAGLREARLHDARHTAATGQLTLTAVADRDTCPDVEVFAEGIRNTLDTLSRPLLAPST